MKLTQETIQPIQDGTSKDMEKSGNGVNELSLPGTQEYKEMAFDICEPKVGMIFETADEAYNFYNEYSRNIGFSVRKLRTNKNRSDRTKIHRAILVCSCEGVYQKKNTPQKKRDHRRFDCKARFEIKLCYGDKYELIDFVSEHSHVLVPLEQRHYIRSQRKIELSQAGIISKMHSSGIKQSQIFSYMCEEAGGAQHLNFIKAYCSNLVQRTRAEFFKTGDAQCLLQYFKQKKEENTQFFYSFRTHGDGEIRSVFFCDAKSRRDYELFGDSVCFDTTFRTNKYDMVCAPIVGINNHGQTILFGCGLLDGETEDAVTWLFTTFLEVMGGKKPVSIFTDQSQAISNAIGALFPDSHHGLCLWHLCQNVVKHMSKIISYKSFSPQLKDCIYEPETIEEFERGWECLLENHNLRENQWLQSTYKLRKKWAQVYSRGYFCAGMTTSQRSESINNFLKSYFNNGNIVLREFVNHYSRAMNDRREKEREAEFKTQQSSPDLISRWSVEREAATIYTRKIFYNFQKELKSTIDLSLEFERDDGTIAMYKVKEMEGRKRIRTLKFKQVDHTVLCTCRSFEFNGILCSHALKLFRHLEYKTLPPQYYLKRWTQAITNEIVLDPKGNTILKDNDSSFNAHYSELSHISQKIVAKGSKSDEIFLLAKSLLLDVEATIEASEVSKDRSMPSIHQNLTEEEMLLCDPSIRRSQGRSRKRIKAPWERAASKKNNTKKGGKATSLTKNHTVTTGGSSGIIQSTQEASNIISQTCGGQNDQQYWMSFPEICQGILGSSKISRQPQHEPNEYNIFLQDKGDATSSVHFHVSPIDKV